MYQMKLTILLAQYANREKKLYTRMTTIQSAITVHTVISARPQLSQYITFLMKNDKIKIFTTNIGCNPNPSSVQKNLLIKLLLMCRKQVEGINWYVT